MISQHVVSKRQYSPTSLTRAYAVVKEDKLSIYKASEVYRVPEQTLRDCVIGRIDIDTVTTGRIPVLSLYKRLYVPETIQIPTPKPYIMLFLIIRSTE